MVPLSQAVGAGGLLLEGVAVQDVVVALQAVQSQETEERGRVSGRGRSTWMAAKQAGRQRTHGNPRWIPLPPAIQCLPSGGAGGGAVWLLTHRQGWAGPDEHGFKAVQLGVLQVSAVQGRQCMWHVRVRGEQRGSAMVDHLTHAQHMRRLATSLRILEHLPDRTDRTGGTLLTPAASRGRPWCAGPCRPAPPPSHPRAGNT